MNKTLRKMLSATLSATMIICIITMCGGAIITTATQPTQYKTGDIIKFGSYPQGQVTDAELLQKLDNVQKNWVSYGYYSESTPGDWMQYADIELKGRKYRAVEFSQYRPRESEAESSAGRSAQDDNGYKTNTVYYFIYEPLNWIILDPAAGLVLCEPIVDAQSYNYTYYMTEEKPEWRWAAAEYYWSDETKNYAVNDYTVSFIRKWLNENFYNTAFNEKQRQDVRSHAINIVDSSNDNNSKVINDKVFLLSAKEVENDYYGFSTNYIYSTTTNPTWYTDYSLVQGLPVNESSKYSSAANYRWWLCPKLSTVPYLTAGEVVNVYTIEPRHNDGRDIDCNILKIEGVRPAITISSLSAGTFMQEEEKYDDNNSSSGLSLNTSNDLFTAVLVIFVTLIIVCLLLIVLYVVSKKEASNPNSRRRQ